MATHLIARFTATPGSEAVVADLLTQLTEQVRAEPGNVVFDAYTSVEDSRTYVVIEAYADEAAFQAHLNSQHSREFNRRLRQLVEGEGSTLNFLSPLEAPQPAVLQS